MEALNETQVRVELGGVNFDALISAIEKLAKTQQVSVLELSIDAIAPSTVNARITFSRL
ncbi:type II secretion system protein M [bacterium]|nr:type II secretion system protein M [bacterium]